MAACDPGDIRVPRELTVYLVGRQVIDEAELDWSGTSRRLAPDIEMPANRQAEVEVHKRAVRVPRALQQEALNLFGDYQLLPLPDGTHEAVTPHRKV
jgi:thymidylate synthase (FAD)